MIESTDKPVILTSDPHVLQKIKYLQFRRQLIPIIVVVLLLVLNIFWPHPYLFYPSLLAFAWYIWERILWRTKNKIAAPEPGTFVSPVNGRISSVKRGEDSTEIILKKSVIDIVELRLPYPGLRMESIRNLLFDTAAGLVSLQIQSHRIAFFENRDVAGEVIGVVPGNSTFEIKVPAGLKILVKPGQAVFGGETVLFSMTEVEDPTRSILVEEPMNDDV
jgi:hypothetical protein